MENHPFCENCGQLSKGEYQWRGELDSGGKRFRCKKCQTWGSVGSSAPETQDSTYSFVEKGQSAFATAVLDMDTIRSDEELIKAIGVNEDEWHIYQKQVGKQAAWRKDREVIWIVKDGKVTEGSVKDSGKVKVIPLFNVKIWMRRKTDEIRTNAALEDLKSGLKKIKIKTKQINYKKQKDSVLYEIEMPDIHIGKLTWGEESGQDSDITTQVRDCENVIEKLLAYSRMFPVEKILFPIGNDYYNVDNNINTTTHGTPQQEDTRWRKSFRVGWQLASNMINMCLEIAPVDVKIIGGNHDEQRSFYLGEVLSSLYSTNRHVSVDNSAKLRKYYQYGKNMIGLTHGYHEKTRELKDLMALEEPQMWANTTYREWHTGDKHHKEDWVHKTHEGNNGVVIRILRSLTTPDAWHYNKGYVGVLRASESFVWDKKCGLIAQFTASPK